MKEKSEKGKEEKNKKKCLLGKGQVGLLLPSLNSRLGWKDSTGLRYLPCILSMPVQIPEYFLKYF